jgi:hypothetical protein
MDKMFEDADPLTVGVHRVEVEAGDLSGPLQVLDQLIESPASALEWCERIDITFGGYDQHREELWEIAAVRDYVHKLDEAFPYWLFFLSRRYLGLQCLALCFMPPYLTEKAKAELFPQHLNDLLLKRWFPAMNHMCAYSGMGEVDLIRLTDSALKYLTTGRDRP